MVAIAYHISRGIGLTLSLLLIFASLSQLCYYLYLKLNNKKIDLKCYIQLGCLFNGVCVMIGFIDAFGAFNLIPFNVTRVLINTVGMRGIIIGLCIIIYSHFAAHYLAAKKTMPVIFERALFVCFILTTIPCLIGAIFADISSTFFRLEMAFQTVWSVSIEIIDAYGYYLVRQLIIDLKKYRQQSFAPASAASSGTSQPQSPTIPPSPRNRTAEGVNSNGTSAEDLLVRIRRYHIFFLTMNTGYVLYGIYAVVSQPRSGFVPPNPDHFSFGMSTSFMPYSFLLIQAILTWWAWTPFTIIQEVYLSTSGGKNVNSTSRQPRKITSTFTAPSPKNNNKDNEKSVQIEISNNTSSSKQFSGLVHSPSEEHNLLGVKIEQNNLDNSIKEETVYSEHHLGVGGGEEISVSGRPGGGDELSVSGYAVGGEDISVSGRTDK